MGFQGFAYTSGTIFQLSFCLERFLFLDRWKIYKKNKNKSCLSFFQDSIFRYSILYYTYKYIKIEFGNKETEGKEYTKILAFNLVKKSLDMYYTINVRKLSLRSVFNR